MKHILLSILSAVPALAGDLDHNFASPPETTRPRCYWYWMDGHVTKAGITKDLEAMKRIGIGEGYIGEISGQSGLPSAAEPKALTDPWWGFIEHAIREGTRLGVDIGVFNSPGWSQSGGPWVKPGQAMRYVTMPETRIHGPAHFEGKLPTPVGEFQDLAVLAFPVPTGEGEVATITGRTPTSVSFAMSSPFAARSITVVPVKKLNVTAALQASDDGQQFRTVKTFTIDRHNLAVNVGPIPLSPVVASFPVTRARFFRLNFSSACEVGDVRLSPAARVECYAEKSLQKVFQDPLPPFDFYSWPAQAEPESADMTIRPDVVQDLSKRMSADGTLRWDVPAGDWIVMRTAMTPTGTMNSPAAPEATGMEVDKMNRTALKAHFDAYIGYLYKRMPAADRKSWKHVVADSYEMGPENWTDGFAADFLKRYGYDPLRFLPAMSGRIVGSADMSNRFLWDVRRLVADRVAGDYVGGLRDLCHEHGMKMWLENYGHWGFPGEFLSYGGNCDEISGEFWANGDLGRVELRDASSAAHIYGKPVVWAEAFTGGPAFVNTPRDLKARGDWALCQGINQFTLHVYIHQPTDEKPPGINAWFGTEFNRNNTWFENAKPWVDYLRRCSVMLQAGNHVADVAYYISEDTPKMAGIRQPELPPGYDYDYINADVIGHRISVKDGRWVLPDGMSYRLLVLPESATMRPSVLLKLSELVAAGGKLLGPAPERSPSLENYPACDEEVKKLASGLWGGGHVLGGTDLGEVLRKLQTPADLTCPEGILWTHRRSGDTDVYFLSNQNDRERTETIRFRVKDRAPELWNPENGRMERPAVYDVTDSGVSLPVHLDPLGSVFVVFRKDADANRIVSVTRDGEPVLDTTATAGVTPVAADGTFTLSLWVNPAQDTTLLPEAASGASALGGKHNFVIFPAHGNTFAPGGGHAGCGLAVGRNGVCVIEHSGNYFAPVLVYATPIAGWTHISLVYRDGLPSLYLNGVLAHKGLKGDHIVHPTPAGSSGGGPFQGDTGTIDQSPRALSDAELLRLAKSAREARGPALTLNLKTEGGLDVRASQAGTYELKFANGKSRKLEVPAIPAPVAISGPWNVSFDPKAGGPEHINFDSLEDWTRRPEPGIRYYSGKAVYRKTFDVPAAEIRKSQDVLLDLGRPAGIAVVRLNGTDLGTLWLAPWRVDISKALKPGANKLEVMVVNNWNNRLAGDAALPAGQRLTSVSTQSVKAGATLQSSGLLGPVRLLRQVVP